MSWYSTLIKSSVGKKAVMALSGLFLCAYLVIHLIGNLMLFAGPEIFNSYVEALSSVKPLVRAIEVLLVGLFLTHILLSIKLTRDNSTSSTIKYDMNKAGENSGFFSRNMGLTGSILFIFLVTHLSTIWYQFQTQHEAGNFYGIVVGDTIGLGNPYITALYCVAMVLLGFHLRHGFQSAFQSFGIRYNKYSGLIEAVAVFFWLIIPAGFLSIALYFGIIGAG
ncbi:MAG: succinate dehydrogenase cytochrome b subunit [Candidatus Marinimicrobia bacterium]|nr:succinate dehydrogenase cytochrome b subunit [Candidatus Neomarinimicrobiota bacterium]